MKKKITACAAIGLAAVMFGACASWKDVYKLSSPDNLADYYAVSGAFAQVTDLSDASGMNYTGYESGAIMFGGDGVQAYYFT